jgi:hypothetical protein
MSSVTKTSLRTSENLQEKDNLLQCTGVSTLNLIADLPGFGEVWYAPNGIANTSCLYQRGRKKSVSHMPVWAPTHLRFTRKKVKAAISRNHQLASSTGTPKMLSHGSLSIQLKRKKSNTPYELTKEPSWPESCRTSLVDHTLEASSTLSARIPYQTVLLSGQTSSQPKIFLGQTSAH